jgi:hypothetical protein
MKLKILIFIIISSIYFSNSYSKQKINCRDLIDKPIEYSKCIAEKSKELGKKGLKSLNTDSKLTDWVKKKLNK